jgi:hypothetical protein
MKLIQTITLGTTASAIEFTSIPQTFTDLKMLISGRSALTSHASFMPIQFNGSGAAEYTQRRLYTDGVAPTGQNANNDSSLYLSVVNAASSTANTFGSSEVYIPNYTGATQKSLSIDAVTESNSATQGHTQASITAGVWANTAAITSIRVSTDVNWVAGTTISLYGITKGSDGIVATS